MEDIFSTRIKTVPRSFIREILKVSIDPSVISFAGGLPNSNFFPLTQIKEATDKVFKQYGKDILQYSNSEGDILLRELIAERYKKTKGLDISVDNILITNGSQQGIDLLGKAVLNEGEAVFIEEPGYLGAIQSLSIFQCRFVPIPIHDEGMDIAELEKACSLNSGKVLYSVPTFQNPSGISYTDDNRKQVADIARKNKIILVEDDPYGELRFAGKPKKSMFQYLPEQSVLLGSFSKVVAPGFRLGWIVAPDWLIEKLLIAKQAADLHTSSFAQKIIFQFLLDNDLDDHISAIIKVYGEQCGAMQKSLADHFPAKISFTRPEGGMFLWGQLPSTMDSMALFEEAAKEQVVFVPGDPFYTTSGRTSTFRLNYSCVNPDTVEEGVKRMARALQKFEKELC